MPSEVGGRLPAHAAAVGKALLAFSPAHVIQAVIDRGLPAVGPRTITAPGLLLRELRRIRDSGIAYENEESAHGVGCAASPCSSDGQAAAAMSISGWSGTLDLRRVGPAVEPRPWPSDVESRPARRDSLSRSSPPRRLTASVTLPATSPDGSAAVGRDLDHEPGVLARAAELRGLDRRPGRAVCRRTARRHTSLKIGRSRCRSRITMPTRTTSVSSAPAAARIATRLSNSCSASAVASSGIGGPRIGAEQRGHVDPAARLHRLRHGSGVRRRVRRCG